MGNTPIETNKIAERFNLVAEKYDSQRRLFIPSLDDYYGTSISFLAKTVNSVASVLDLGAGTGLLTKYLYQQFPESNYTLVDISDQMLNVARKRFSGLTNFTFSICDYSKKMPEGKFDLIASALSIHHLENDTKATLYSNIFNCLPMDGCFINLDQFNASSDHLNEQYNSWWYDFIVRSGITEKERASWLARRELDKENTIGQTKNMLTQAGFKIVECIYSFMKFGVILAIK